jgi:hypothetical protein
MGMFTRIRTKDDEIIQIHCGNDLCEIFNIGDAVPFYVNPEIMGSVSFADDAYGGYSENDSTDNIYWVIIKNSIVETVLRPEDIDCNIDNHKASYSQIQAHLREKYALKPIESNYSTECLKKYYEECEAERLKTEQLIQQYKDQGLSDLEILGKFMCAPLEISINYPKSINKIIQK